MRVVFIGVGLMGRGMVANLVAAGHEVTAFARTPTKVSGLAAPVTGSLSDAARGCDAALICVTDGPDVSEVVRALLGIENPPSLVIDLSTIAPATARTLANECSEVGIDYLDCPVSGGPPGAAAGTLAIMCGGTPEAYTRATPLLDAMGDPKKRTHCGPVGAGLVAKLVNNLLVGVITAATAQALGAGQRAGIDPALLRDVIMGATGNSWQLENLFPRVLKGDHAPGFSTANLRKDLGHALGLDDVPLSFGAQALELFEQVDGDLDYGAVARLFMDLPAQRDET